MSLVIDPDEQLTRCRPIGDGFVLGGRKGIYHVAPDYTSTRHTNTLAPVSDLATDKTGLLAVAGVDGSLSLGGPDCSISLSLSAQALLAVDISDGMSATGGLDQYVTLVDVAEGKPVWRVCGHAAAVLAVAFAPANTPSTSLMASAGADGVIRVWDGRSKSPAGDRLRGTAIDDDNPPVCFVQWSPDGLWLLATTAGDDCIRLWDIRAALPYNSPAKGEATKPRCARTFKGARWTGAPFSSSSTPSSRIKGVFLDQQSVLAVDGTRSVLVWDIQSRGCILKRALNLSPSSVISDYAVVDKGDESVDLVFVTGDGSLYVEPNVLRPV